MRKKDLKDKIIAYLSNQTDWTTTTKLADHLDVSVRSVKNYISALNAETEDLIVSTNKGYRINKDRARELMSEEKDEAIPEGYESRKSYIVKAILLDKQDLSIEELADYLCVSVITLQNDISRMRSDFAEYHLNIRTKNDHIYITGLDKDKRKAIIDLIDSEIDSSYYSLDYIQGVFANIDVREVQKIVIGVLNRYEYFLDNYSLINYVLHLCLTIEIKGNAGDVEYAEEDLSAIASEQVRAIVTDIYSELKKVYDTNYTLNDILGASVLMMTRVLSTDTQSLDYRELSHILGKDVVSLLDKIIRSVNDTYAISLDDNSFLIRFAFHLKNLLIRLQNDIRFSNLQFPNIKNEYPLIYAISVHISDIVAKHAGKALSEEEIAYIALHIGMMMEENRATRERISCVILCTDYIGIGKKLFSKLTNIFNENLLISNVVTELNDEILNSTDLIITTERITSGIQIPVVYIDPFLSESNIRDIFSMIDEIKSKRRENIIREKIMFFFHEDLFFVDQDFRTDSDAIDRICDVMIARQYVDRNYKEEIIRHEKISPSSYGNIAIAHPLDNEAKSSVIAVSLNKNPVLWADSKVNMIFMLSLAEQDRELFRDIFDFITDIINDSALFRKLLNVSDFDEFVNTLVANY